MPDKKTAQYNILKKKALDAGAQIFGVSTVDYTSQRVSDIASGTVRKLPYAVSIGVRLSLSIIEDIADHPTKLYFHHYRQVNYFLDRIAITISNIIQQKGFNALPLPASQTIGRDVRLGHFSHREAARRAGVGWIGRNNLLVTPAYGARIRLVTILTDIPLKTGKPLSTGCGSCIACIKACPAGAIKKELKNFDGERCFQQLDTFRKHGIGHHICGICVKACTGK